MISIGHKALILLVFENEQGGPQDEVGDVYKTKASYCYLAGSAVA
jgi:hypothetical protein